MRVGIVGSGKIAEVHVPYIRKAGGEIVGLADTSLERANDFADRYGIQRIYADVGELVGAENPDIVHVLTPPHTHAEVAVEALKRGVHTIVEKPMALSSDEVIVMSDAARSGGAMLTVDHNRLFDPVVLEARRLVEGGDLGELVGVESFQAGVASERSWLGELSGRGLGDLLPHPLYLQLAFLGEVTALEAFAFGGEPGGDPEELRVLMYSEARSGVLTITMNASPRQNTLKLYGSRMTVEVNLNNMTIIKRREREVPKLVGKSLPNIEEAWQLFSQTVTNTIDFISGKTRFYPGMGTLLDGFYRAVREKGVAPVGILEAAQVVAVTERIWRAVAKNEVGAELVART